ncbi:hypothetical protein [Marinilactibacillus piezotolerans]|uniref:hypothetical protein n=1 Tax=Marinilactibacillus piezotolerans TaxID=258723 RepID=UPI0009B0FF01|nr:hypothetical protein [Marinilactibacillus piezotolerans]
MKTKTDRHSHLLNGFFMLNILHLVIRIALAVFTDEPFYSNVLMLSLGSYMLVQGNRSKNNSV